MADKNKNNVPDNIDKYVEAHLNKIETALRKVWEDLDEYKDESARPKLSKLIVWIKQMHNKIAKQRVSFLSESIVNVSSKKKTLLKEYMEYLQQLMKQFPDNKHYKKYRGILKEASDYKMTYGDITTKPERAKKIEKRAEDNDKDVEVDLDENFDMDEYMGGLPFVQCVSKFNEVADKLIHTFDEFVETTERKNKADFIAIKERIEQLKGDLAFYQNDDDINQTYSDLYPKGDEYREEIVESYKPITKRDLISQVRGKTKN